MTDSEFLSWLRDRLIFVYDEPPNVDFVLRLGEIASRNERLDKAVMKAIREKVEPK